VKPVLFANTKNLHFVLLKAFEHFTDTSADIINYDQWNNSEYSPTPTIVEAAQHLFSGQNVR
jgi:hypothetical protein